MIGSARELTARLALVRRVLARSPEPLHAPLGIVFRPVSGEEHLARWADHGERAARGETFAPATLYVNIPFCARVCTYCSLSASQMPKRPVLDAYVSALRRHVALMEPLVRGLSFGSVHVGGGTPTLLDEGQLDLLLSDLSRLPLAEGAQIGVEAHPATSTPGRLSVLRRHGVDRVSFGVESLTPVVLRNVNRQDQNEARVQAAIDAAKELGFSINIDLLAGLPGETEASWAQTVQKTLELEPDSLSVNRFLGENSALAAFGYGPGEAQLRATDAMLVQADALIRELAPPRWPEEPLARAGYGTQYVWDRSDAARRYFQQDMIGPVSTLAIGHGALGHVYGQCYSVPAGTSAEYVEQLERGRPPQMMECAVDERFEMAFFVAEHACRGELSPAVFRRLFGRALSAAFPHELPYLLRCGLLVARGDRIARAPRRDFSMTHMLAFLLRDSPTLARQASVFDEAISVGPDDDLSVEHVRIERGEDVSALVERSADAGKERLRIDVGEGLDAEAATQLAEAGRARGLRVEVRGDARTPLRDYDHVLEDIPPSMLWVRIAIRASQAGRGEQRLIVVRRRGADASDASG